MTRFAVEVLLGLALGLGVIVGIYKYGHKRGYDKRSAEVVAETQELSERVADVRNEVAAGADDVADVTEAQAEAKTIYNQSAIRRVGVLEGRIQALKEQLHAQRKNFDSRACPVPDYVLRDQAKLDGILRSIRGANGTGSADNIPRLAGAAKADTLAGNH